MENVQFLNKLSNHFNDISKLNYQTNFDIYHFPWNFFFFCRFNCLQNYRLIVLNGNHWSCFLFYFGARLKRKQFSLLRFVTVNNVFCIEFVLKVDYNTLRALSNGFLFPKEFAIKTIAQCQRTNENSSWTENRNSSSS